jgi:hypothetical protein
MFWQAERVNPRCRMPPSRLSAGRSSALYGIMIASLPADPDARWLPSGSRTDRQLSVSRAVHNSADGAHSVVRHKAGDPVRLSNFSINERKVEDYRSGRVFVAGDAAHVHSPAGGQGMNTGMQDAFNLTWKLALVSSGLCRPEPLLSSYSIERSHIARLLLEFTGKATAASIMRGAVKQSIRNHVASERRQFGINRSNGVKSGGNFYSWRDLGSDAGHLSALYTRYA